MCLRVTKVDWKERHKGYRAVWEEVRSGGEEVLKRGLEVLGSFEAFSEDFFGATDDDNVVWGLRFCFCIINNVLFEVSDGCTAHADVGDRGLKMDLSADGCTKEEG